MKRIALAAVLALVAAPLTFAQSVWKADTAHSEVDFTIKHLSLSNVHGRFHIEQATINYNDADVTKSTVSAAINVASIDTGEAARDTHVKSPDFFDVEHFASATFQSTKVEKTAGGLRVSGNFTLHGITKPIVLDVTNSAPIESPMDHKLHAGFEATTTISRAAFNIGTKFPEAILSDAVKLTIELEVVKQ